VNQSLSSSVERRRSAPVAREQPQIVRLQARDAARGKRQQHAPMHAHGEVRRAPSDLHAQPGLEREARQRLELAVFQMLHQRVARVVVQ
jgi:hypothetical protein